MKQSEIAGKYSLALFELGKEKDELFQFRDELANLLHTIKEYPDLKQLFFHPQVRAEDKKSLVQEVFASGLSKEILNFLKILIDRRRESYLESIYKSYLDLLNKEKNILEVEVVSAIKLSGNLKEKLEKRLVNLSGSNIVIKEKVDPEIIGGLIIKFADRIIDGSIRNELEALRNKIVQIPVSELGV